MSNLNTHGVTDYASALRFLDGKSARTLCFATTLQQDAAHGTTVISVRHHGSVIIQYLPTGEIFASNAGWLSATTTDRLHRMTPPEVRVSRAKGGHVESPLYSGAQPSTLTRVI